MPLTGFAALFLRGSLVLTLFAMGYVKFFAFEVQNVAPLIAAHPLLAWLGLTFGEVGASHVVGGVEIVTSLLLAVGFLWPAAGLVGGAAAMAIFLASVTLMLVMPAMLIFEPSAGGFPVVTTLGGSLIKDVVLLAAAFSCSADSLIENQRGAILLRDYN